MMSRNLAFGFRCKYISEHQLMSLDRTLPKGCCSTCFMKLTAELAASGMRCGKNYYESSPGERKALALYHYPVVQTANTCDSWMAVPPRIRVAREA